MLVKTNVYHTIHQNINLHDNPKLKSADNLVRRKNADWAIPQMFLKVYLCSYPD